MTEGVSIELKKGSHVDDWILQEQVGKGGQGEVWRVRPNGVRHTPERAMKVCRAADSRPRERFERELSLLGRCKGIPHVMPVLKARTDWTRGYAYYVMPLASETLAQRRRGTREVIGWLRSLASCLGQMHEAGVLHRDLKPENIFVMPEEPRVMLGDFGIASDQAEQGVLTQVNEVVGSRYYRAPEVASGKPHSERSDVYSLGRVMQFMLCGTLESSQIEASRGLTLRGATALEAVIVRATAIAPQQRFGSMQEFEAALPELRLDVATQEMSNGAPWVQAVVAAHMEPVPEPEVRGLLTIGPTSVVGTLRSELGEPGRKPLELQWKPHGQAYGVVHLAPSSAPSSPLRPADAKRLLDAPGQLRIPGLSRDVSGMVSIAGDRGRSLVVPARVASGASTRSLVMLQTRMPAQALVGYAGNVMSHEHGVPVLDASALEEALATYVEGALDFLAKNLAMWFPCACTFGVIGIRNTELALPPSGDGLPTVPRRTSEPALEVDAVGVRCVLGSPRDPLWHQALDDFANRLWSEYGEVRGSG